MAKRAVLVELRYVSNFLLVTSTITVQSTVQQTSLPSWSKKLFPLKQSTPVEKKSKLVVYNLLRGNEMNCNYILATTVWSRCESLIAFRPKFVQLTSTESLFLFHHSPIRSNRDSSDSGATCSGGGRWMEFGYLHPTRSRNQRCWATAWSAWGKTICESETSAVRYIRWYLFFKQDFNLEWNFYNLFSDSHSSSFHVFYNRSVFTILFY